MKEREYQVMFDAEDRHWWYRTLHDLILHYVRREFARKGPLNILDAGCGTGGLLSRLGAMGRTTGCDASPTAAEFCKRRGLSHVINANLLDVDLDTNAYDVVTIIDVLYHQWVRSESDVLSRAYKAMRPGGLLVTNDPAFECLRGTHDKAVFGQRRFRRAGFARSLHDAGFVVEHMTYRLLPLFAPIWAVRFAQRWALNEVTPSAEVASDIAVPAPLINAVLHGIGRLDNAVVRHVQMPLGTSLFTVARKPL